MVLSNKRNYPRVDLSVNEKCYFEYWKQNRKRGFFNRPTSVLTKNISGSGLMFLSRKFIKPATIFNAEIQLPGNHKPILCQASVVRCEQDKGKQEFYHVSVTYINIDSDDRSTIIQFCEKNLRI
ncbi:MAG: PilZ domain-containing protein [Candidatus Auribacterota bacterium]|nr:PilZ domain-containing protein [Candidatus Auribacterota bacterium]